MTNVARSQGWHVFELYLDANTASIMIDGELVAAVPSEGKNYVCEKTWLVANKGDAGHWAAVELLHTPPLSAFRRQCASQCGYWPWYVTSVDEGCWQIVRSDDETLVCQVPSPQPPPRVQHIVEPMPPAADANERPASAGGLFTIECWSLPGESDLARIERVMSVFVEQLVASGVIIPENFERVGRCGARSDPQPCHIYRFGSRRLHINIRETEGGRLCLVVRCGGGFLDFAEFARKNGSVEQMKFLKLQRRSSQGRDVLQLASVYSNRSRRLKDLSSANAPRPGTSRRNNSITQ